MAREIVTDRLILRQLSVDGARALIAGRAAAAGDGYPLEASFVAARMALDHVERGVDPGPFGNYQIVPRDGGEPVGDIGFYAPPDADGAVEVGFGLCRSARGRGYATEALRALLCWALGEGGARTVEADANPANLASQRALERAGMRYAGDADGLRRYRADASTLEQAEPLPT